MVLGMLPTAMSHGEGSEFRAPMAIAVIGGVVSSTLLSLIVVPVFYLAIENLKRWLPRASSRARGFFTRGRARPSVAHAERCARSGVESHVFKNQVRCFSFSGGARVRLRFTSGRRSTCTRAQRATRDGNGNGSANRDGSGARPDRC